VNYSALLNGMPKDKTTGYAQSSHVMQAASRSDHVEPNFPFRGESDKGLKLREKPLTTPSRPKRGHQASEVQPQPWGAMAPCSPLAARPASARRPAQ
jgi:hypothetical protein